MDYSFLHLEAREILFAIQPLFKIFKHEFINIMVADLIKLAALILNNKKEIKDGDIFFTTMIIYVFHQDIDTNEKQKVCDIVNEFYGKNDVAKVTKRWPLIKKYFPDKIEIKTLTLPSFKVLKKHDSKNGTSYFDLVRTNFSKFIRVLIKADGKVTRDEKSIEKKINKILFPHGKPQEKKEESGFFQLIGIDENDITIKKGESGITLTIGGNQETLSEETHSEKSIPENEISAENLETVMDELNSLVGLKNIKKQIKTFVNLLKIKKERRERGMPETEMSLHAVFYGPPGTGKTTVARLLGRVYKSLGFLAKGHVVETDRAGLVAGFIGQTAIQTEKVIEQAMDGILFIDEAYSLKGNQNDFGSEAIDTILKRMEDNRERLVVIAAGYPDEMEEFISSNPGLRSRFGRYYYFKDYSPAELVKIFILFCKKAALTVARPAEKKLMKLFELLYTSKDKSFGNGRLARNLFEKVLENQANRLVEIAPLTDEILSTITEEDIPESF